MEQRRIRLAAVGDELLAGHGDPRALGWLGRVLARTTPDNATLEAYSLAAPGEGTEALANRWLMEAGRRFDETCENRLVIGLSDRDLDLELSTARSRLNLANILDVADQRRIPAFVVGPPPGRPADADRLADLSAAYADVATRRRVPYVDTFTPLAAHEQWLADMAAGDGVLPSQAGYGLMAWLVLHTGWHTWLGLPDDGA